MSLQLFDLTGKRALVTGSSQGIGMALARGMAAAGAEGSKPVPKLPHGSLGRAARHSTAAARRRRPRASATPATPAPVH